MLISNFKLKLILFLLFYCLSRVTPNTWAQSGWIQQNSGSIINLNSIFFTNSNIGYTTGIGPGPNGILLMTVDGGLTWTQIPNNYGYSLFFVDVNTGYICGIGGGIGKTTNGGLNWVGQMSNVYTDLLSIYFVNSTTGFSCGMNGQMVKTTNGGTNWYILTTGTYDILTSLFFADLNTGYTVSYRPNFNGSIFNSTNGGIDWTVQVAQTNFYAYSVYFINNNTGYVAGSQGQVMKTTNSGNNWTYSYQGISSSNLRSIRFINGTTGYVVGSGGSIYKTINGANNWYQQTSGTTKNLRSVFFIDQNTGWAVGDSGIILKTTDGGGPIGIKPISNRIPDGFKLYQNYPNPFNPVTKIKFDVRTPLNPPFRKGGTEQLVKLVVFDVLGREVAVLVNELLKPGSYEVDWDGSNYTSGVYFYRLMTGDFTEVKKMLLVK